jgi:hypothetical protein
MKKLLAMAAIAMALTTGSAPAATLSGQFQVIAANVTNLNSAQSQATFDNVTAALGRKLGDGDEDYAVTVFGYDGALDFRVGGPQNASQTIADWLGTGTGDLFGLSDTFGSRQLSEANINDGSAITTFFLFSLVAGTTAGDFEITHDDGVAVFDDTVLLGGNVGPTGETFTLVEGYDGGTLEFLYVATNGNPSIFEVEANPIPLPAALPMLLAGLGLAGWVGRRRKGA